MTDFEKWQIGIGVIQSIILLVTFLAALRIGWTQNKINQNLLDLSYIPSVEVTYENQRINIINKGQTNLLLWGTQLADAERAIETQPRFIAPSGFYYLLADRLEARIQETIGTNGETNIPLSIFIASQNEKKYVIKALLFVKVSEGNIAIHTQTISATQENWT